MWGRPNNAGAVRLVTMACLGTAAMAVMAGTAVAGPAPRPPAQKPKPAGHAKAGHHHSRPRTVVRCQNDDTDQLDEFGDDGEEPRHVLTPAQTGTAGRCAGDALDIARILAGDHVRPRAHGTYGRADPRGEISSRGMSRTRPPLRLIGERRPRGAATEDQEPRP